MTSPPGRAPFRRARRDDPMAALGNRARGRVRPVSPAGPILGAVFALLAWAAVAHNSGSGWVQALGAVLAGVLIVGLLGPAVAVGRARVTTVAAPDDAVAGARCELTMTGNVRVRVRPLVPPGPPAFVGPGRATRATPRPRAAWLDGASRADSDGAGQRVELIPERRGVFDGIVVEVASAAPFGLLWWSRTVRVPLEEALVVAPRLGSPLDVPAEHDDASGSASARVAAIVGEPRGVRPYRPGDSRRWVHWPATAHAGTLMVREMEGPTAEPVTVDVELPADPDQAEVTAEHAFGTVASLLRRGVPVLLVTREPAGVVKATVGDDRRAGRRLARAVAPSDDHDAAGREIGVQLRAGTR